MRIDFLALNPAEETGPTAPSAFDAPVPAADFTIEIPREVATFVAKPKTNPNERANTGPVTRAPAYLPLSYISDARGRIEVYRKLAQATEKPALERLAAEMRDRFGPLPAAVELLLLVGELKILAAEKGVTSVEVKEDKLMLTRQNDLLTIGGKFPRLSKKGASPRLKEIKRLLLSL